MKDEIDHDEMTKLWEFVDRLEVLRAEQHRICIKIENVFNEARRIGFDREGLTDLLTARQCGVAPRSKTIPMRFFEKLWREDAR